MSGATIDPEQLHLRVTGGRVHTVHLPRIATARAATARAGHELDTARTGLDAAWTGSTARAAQRALDARSLQYGDPLHVVGVARQRRG